MEAGVPRRLRGIPDRQELRELAMKLITRKTLLMMLITCSLAITASSLTAQVYKVVDENGNVTYTDRPPADGSAPMELPPISIIESPDYKANTGNETADAEEEIPLNTLRRDYNDFAIISPSSEESIWSPEQAVSVAWNVGNQLQAGMKVTIFLDGKLLTTTTQPIIPAGVLERGAHTLTAQLKDAKNRTIVNAAPVTFYVKQPTVFTNPNRSGG
jgi:hypothetical protein